MRERCVEPEILDQLPADDPRAVRARRDLKRANALMMHHIIMARTLRKYVAAAKPRVLVDLGSGDGTFMLRVAQRLAPRWSHIRVVLVDQTGNVSPETQAEFAALGWQVEMVRASVAEFCSQMRSDRVDAITANLFLHHLSDESLRELFSHAAPRTDLFVTCELQRTAFVREIGRMQWIIGAGEVACHDGVISARAAFREKEISALWPDHRGWRLFEYPKGPMTHVFVAERRTQAQE
jgi:hypothetical protein